MSEKTTIDGAVRDSVELRESSFQAFSRSVGPFGGGKEGPGQVNMPISCESVAVHPGAIVVGDGDGVVIVPHSLIDAALEGAQKKLANEEKQFFTIREGADDEIYPPWLIPTLREKGILGEDEDL